MKKVMVDFDTAFPVISVFLVHGVFHSSYMILHLFFFVLVPWVKYRIMEFSRNMVKLFINL